MMKYKDWMKEWLENYVKASLKQRTYTRYAEIVCGHILPTLGEYNIEEITPLKLQRYTKELLQKGNQRTGKGLSANSVNGIITVVQTSLKTAFKLGIVKEYAGDRIRRPKVQEKQVTCFTKQEQRAIEQEIFRRNTPKLYGIIISLYTGIRIGELLALTWADIDITRGAMTINKTCYEGRDKTGKYVRITESPKTNSSIREVPVPKQLLMLMKDWKKESHSEYVVSNGEKGVSLRGYQRIFERLLNKIKIPHKGFHALRHTFATRALECGMDVKTLSEILGHKNTNITLNRYVHSLMEHKREMMNRVGRLISEL